MRNICLILTIVLSFSAAAQNHFRNIDRSGPSLVATKGSRIQHYRLGAAVRIVTETAGTRTNVKGYLTHFSQDNITVESFRRDTSSSTTVYTNAIQKVKFLSRRGRKKAIILLGAGAVYAGVVALITQPSAYQYILFLPAMAAAFYFTYYFPLTYLFDAILQKSKQKGWSFSVDPNP